MEATIVRLFLVKRLQIEKSQLNPYGDQNRLHSFAIISITLGRACSAAYVFKKANLRRRAITSTAVEAYSFTA
uniref:Uncharacterized protein n=1 Tax=Romanomermis culicivorax TaxID=13658 RepID=A0A915KH56_ROMCU